ncbi:hypothetical protein EYV94_27985 [Puteibacter caeruleilacunae]|nr:hypothetical protein EYV94_27985 [Puteibacter caeruleilacunae]
MKVLCQSIRIAVLISLLLSCEDNGRSKYIAELCQGSRCYYLTVVIPVAKNNERIHLCTTNTELYDSVYKKGYQDRYNFLEFFKKVLDYDIQLNFDNFQSDCVVLQESKVDELYRQKGFKYIMSKYLKESEPLTYAIKGELTEQETYSLVRVMFENNYFVFFDGYSGEYSFMK